MSEEQNERLEALTHNLELLQLEHKRRRRGVTVLDLRERRARREDTE